MVKMVLSANSLLTEKNVNHMQIYRLMQHLLSDRFADQLIGGIINTAIEEISGL